MRIRSVFAAAAVAAAVVLAGCSGTKPVQLWRDPTSQVVFKKIMVAVIGVDMATRRNTEEVLLKRLPPGSAVASYQVIPAGEEKDLEKLKAVLKEASFDGVLVLRLMGVDQEITTTTMAGTANVYGYWGYSHTAMYAQPMVDVRKIAKIESKLFDVVAEKPVWAMVTETVDPSKREVIIDEVTEIVVQQLAEAKLIAGRK
jgi:hypothetical protein